MSTFSGALHRRRHALEPAHRAQAHVQIQHLAQRDVQRADAAADRRGQRALDRHQVFAAGGDGLVRQPGVEQVVRLLAGVHLHPVDLALAAVGLLHGCIDDAHRGAPDVRAGAVAFDERDDRLVGNVELAVLDGDLLPLRGHVQFDCGRHRRTPWSWFVRGGCRYFGGRNASTDSARRGRSGTSVCAQVHTQKFTVAVTPLPAFSRRIAQP